MVRINDEGSITYYVDPKFCQSVLHGKELIVMDRVVMLSWLKLTLLIADDTFDTICVELHSCTSDGKITCITDHVKWSVLVSNC